MTEQEHSRAPDAPPAGPPLTTTANRPDEAVAPASAAVATHLQTRAGKLILVLLCAVAFLDFVDASIVNVALPLIRTELGISVANLPWVPSGYLLTYGGFILLGGRLADTLGRRRLLISGTTLFGAASLAGGLAQGEELLIAARLVQGLGAALMLPAALSTLTTTFSREDRVKALAAWGAMAGLGSAVGVLAGGVLTEALGWRWVFFVNLPACLLIVLATLRLLPDDRQRGSWKNFDLAGAVLVTAGTTLLVFGLVRAPQDGWGSAANLGALAGALVLLIAFVANESRAAHPLLPLSIFRIKGLAAINVAQLIGVAGFISMFFFVTLYMQDVLGFSAITTGLAYLPVTVGIGAAAGASPQLIARFGTRSVFVVGTLVAAAGVLYLASIPVDGSYARDLLPGLLVMSVGLGAQFVSATTAANNGVPAGQAGLAASLLNASQQLGGALGLAVFSVVATSRTLDLLQAGTADPQALTSGFGRALTASSISLVVAALIALRTPNTRDTSEPSA